MDLLFFMRSLLLIAHGSRREASNDEVRELTKQLRNYAAKKGDGSKPLFEYVDCAFLELAPPSIPEGIHMCVSKGATEITVLPYFLSAGRHVSEDIPAEVDSVREKYPDVEIKITDYLGSSAGICELLLSLTIK